MKMEQLQLKESDILTIRYNQEYSLIRDIITKTKCKCISILDADFFYDFDWSWIPECVKIITFDLCKTDFDDKACDIGNTKLEVIIVKTHHGLFTAKNIPKTLKLLICNNNITCDETRNKYVEHYGKHNQYEYYYNWFNSGNIYYHSEDEDNEITQILQRFMIDHKLDDFMMVKMNNYVK